MRQLKSKVVEIISKGDQPFHVVGLKMQGLRFMCVVRAKSAGEAKKKYLAENPSYIVRRVFGPLESIKEWHKS